jgi:RHS repeat-associated protein
LGSTRALSDVAGVVTDRYDYAAFGEGLNQSGATENRYRFTGEQFDETLNQYYLRARYYNQNIGRFTQQDTYQGNNFDPATLHKYLYANADPSNKIDPSGHMSLGSLMAGINVQAILVNTAVGVPSFAIGFAAGDGVLNAGIPHVYEEENEVCTKSPAPNDPCNFDNVYQGLLRYPAPFMFGGDPVYDGKETTLVLFRTVRHSVSRGRVVNTTMPNHLLYPGYVDRTVEESGNSISVRTYGEGSGAFPLLNTYFSDPLWSSVDRQIRNYVSGSYF